MIHRTMMIWVIENDDEDEDVAMLIDMVNMYDEIQITYKLFPMAQKSLCW